MTAQQFNRTKAEQYDAVAALAVFSYDQVFTMAAAQLYHRVPESGSVLVVGCGTGNELITFASAVPQWRLTGVDPSEEMLTLAKQKRIAGGFDDRIHLEQGFVHTLSQEILYDAATLIFTLRFVAADNEKAALFRQIAQRLRTGAPLLIIEQYGNAEEKEFQDNLRAWKQFMVFRGLQPNAADAILAQAMEKSLITEQQLQALLSEAGFSSLRRFYNAFIHGGWIVQKQ